MCDVDSNNFVFGSACENNIGCLRIIPYLQQLPDKYHCSDDKKREMEEVHTQNTITASMA